MRKKQVNQQVVKDERRRLKEFRRKDWAARVIQRAWKRLSKDINVVMLVLEDIVQFKIVVDCVT